MPRCKLAKPGDRQFRSVVPAQPNILRISRDADTDVSETMTAGVAVFENCRLPWDVDYDEYLYCLEGVLRVREEDVVHEVRPGDGLWLPKGVKVAYECDGRATLVYAIYPINWRDLQAKKQAKREAGRRRAAAKSASKAQSASKTKSAGKVPPAKKPSQARAARKPSRKAAGRRR